MITTIITTYGGGNQLQRAIDSVLQQTYQMFEIVVVDDNNPDTVEREQTEKYMMKYVADSRIKYVKHQKNKNGSAARNTGIRMAEGKYISFLDDDDYYLPKRFEKILELLNDNPSFIGVYTGTDILDEDENVQQRIRPDHNLSVKNLLLDEMALGTGSNIFIKKEIAIQVYGFDEDFIRRQDIEFMIRICEQGVIGYISEPLVVKSVNGIRNIPAYEKMKVVINQYMNKFRKEIEELEETEINQFYAVQYRALFFTALYERNPIQIKEALFLLQKYERIQVKDLMLAFIYSHNIRDNKIINFGISLTKIIKSKKYRK